MFLILARMSQVNMGSIKEWAKASIISQKQRLRTSLSIIILLLISWRARTTLPPKSARPNLYWWVRENFYNYIYRSIFKKFNQVNASLSYYMFNQKEKGLYDKINYVFSFDWENFDGIGFLDKVSFHSTKSDQIPMLFQQPSLPKLCILILCWTLRQLFASLRTKKSVFLQERHIFQPWTFYHLYSICIREACNEQLSLSYKNVVSKVVQKLLYKYHCSLLKHGVRQASYVTLNTHFFNDDVRTLLHSISSYVNGGTWSWWFVLKCSPNAFELARKLQSVWGHRHGEKAQDLTCAYLLEYFTISWQLYSHMLFLQMVCKWHTCLFCYNMRHKLCVHWYTGLKAKCPKNVSWIGFNLLVTSKFEFTW